MGKSNSSIEDQRKKHVLRAKKAGLGPLIKKNRENMDDSYTGSTGNLYTKKRHEAGLSDQVIKGYFSGNLRTKNPLSEEQDMETDIQNATNNYYRGESARRLAHLQDTAKPQRIQVTPGEWTTASKLKGK